MIHCKELNKSFETKEEMFSELKACKSDIIARKKADIHKSCKKGASVTVRPLSIDKLQDQVKGIDIDENHYYIVVNTTRILDSHKDLHLDGIWNKTVKEQQGKNYLVADHMLQLDQTIARKEHVQMFVATVPFAILGLSYKGETEALIYKVRKDKVINQTAKEWLDSGDSIEASVRMQYIDIVFALKSDNPDDKKERKNFDDLVGLIANEADFDEEILYFWGVKQARNVLESSLVIFGSNGATGQITEESKDQPLKDTDKTIEPSKDTHKDYYLQLLKN